MNLWKKIKQTRLERDCKPVDAQPMIEMAMDIAKNGNKKEREEFIKAIRKGSEEAGKQLTKLAIMKKMITDDQLKEFKRRGFKNIDIAPVLQLLLSRKPGHKEQDAILTADYSIVYKNRAWLKKEFNIDAMTAADIEKLHEEMKDEGKL